MGDGADRAGGVLASGGSGETRRDCRDHARPAQPDNRTGPPKEAALDNPRWPG
jgi:hypothetical protein